MGVSRLIEVLARRFDANRWLRPLAIATLVFNIAIVITGGAVRLTGSGLGCPTWPRCTQESFVPHGELDLHGAIEFGNRMFSFVLVAVVVATWVAAMLYRPPRRSLRLLATALALGVPGQALVGGLVVLTDLSPWMVSLHLLLSMGLIVLAVLLLRRIGEGDGAARPRATPLVRLLVRVVFGLTVVVVYAGTVVTGSGPHAGDPDVTRNGLDPRVVSYIHGDLAGLLVLLTAALLVLSHLAAAPRDLVRATRVLLAVLLLQALVGITQYRLDLPELLVGLHLFGAALAMAAASRLLFSIRARDLFLAEQNLGQRANNGSRATARKSSAR